MSGASAEASVAGSSSMSGQKRRAFRSVQEAREKLTYKSASRPEFDYELLLMFVKNEFGYLFYHLDFPMMSVSGNVSKNVLGSF